MIFHCKSNTSKSVEESEIQMEKKQQVQKKVILRNYLYITFNSIIIMDKFII